MKNFAVSLCRTFFGFVLGLLPTPKLILRKPLSTLSFEEFRKLADEFHDGRSNDKFEVIDRWRETRRRLWSWIHSCDAYLKLQDDYRDLCAIVTLAEGKPVAKIDRCDPAFSRWNMMAGLGELKLNLGQLGRDEAIEALALAKLESDRNVKKIKKLSVAVTKLKKTSDRYCYDTRRDRLVARW